LCYLKVSVRVDTFVLFRYESRTDANGETASVERYIWGATAAMLRNRYRFLMAHPAG
jgi:hypothetical protein